MEYRFLPHGGEKISVLGLGAGSLHESADDEIEQTYREAIEAGVTFFDLCGGKEAIFRPFGRAIRGHRKDVLFQLHFGAVYDAQGNYGWSRDLEVIKRTFERERRSMEVAYADFGFLHCIDDEEDLREIVQKGILDYVRSLKQAGVVRHIGFSSHTPSVAQKVLDFGGMDMMMFSINPAFDFEKAGEGDYGFGKRPERERLFWRCVREGVGISVMKPFNGGRLLSEKTSPFHVALTKDQCLGYCLDRPGVLTVLPGVRNRQDLRDILSFLSTTKEERDYASVLEKAKDGSMRGSCVYCDHCLPCPRGIDVGLVHKYYDLAMAGDAVARGHYEKLAIKADKCVRCGHCDRRCPFDAQPMERMGKIAEYFGK